MRPSLIIHIRSSKGGVTQVKKVGRGRTRSDESAGSTVTFGTALVEICSFGMVLVAEAQQLKAKLMLKGKWRPEKNGAQEDGIPSAH